MLKFETPSQVLRSSVASVFAVAVISLLAWSFESYRDHLWEARSPAIASAGGQPAQITETRDA